MDFTPCIHGPDCMTRNFGSSQVGIEVVTYRTIFLQMHDVRLGFDIQWVCLFTVILQQFSLCLKESLQLATTRGYFISRVHYLVHDGYCRIEPVRSYPQNYQMESLSYICSEQSQLILIYKWLSIRCCRHLFGGNILTNYSLSAIAKYSCPDISIR